MRVWKNFGVKHEPKIGSIESKILNSEANMRRKDSDQLVATIAINSKANNNVNSNKAQSEGIGYTNPTQANFNTNNHGMTSNNTTTTTTYTQGIGESGAINKFMSASFSESVSAEGRVMAQQQQGNGKAVQMVEYVNHAVGVTATPGAHHIH